MKIITHEDRKEENVENMKSQRASYEKLVYLHKWVKNIEKP
jgi:hypothetical protein